MGCTIRLSNGVYFSPVMLIILVDEFAVMFDVKPRPIAISLSATVTKSNFAIPISPSREKSIVFSLFLL